MVDYRLAPEFPFPAALNDSITAYQWLLNQGYDSQQIIMAGDSAGGGLTLATLIAARERGLPLPASVVLLSPWTDLTGSGKSVEEVAAEDVLLTWENLSVITSYSIHYTKLYEVRTLVRRSRRFD